MAIIRGIGFFKAARSLIMHTSLSTAVASILVEITLNINSHINVVYFNQENTARLILFVAMKRLH